MNKKIYILKVILLLLLLSDIFLVDSCIRVVDIMDLKEDEIPQVTDNGNYDSVYIDMDTPDYYFTLGKDNFGYGGDIPSSGQMGYERIYQMDPLKNEIIYISGYHSNMDNPYVGHTVFKYDFQGNLLFKRHIHTSSRREYFIYKKKYFVSTIEGITILDMDKILDSTVSDEDTKLFRKLVRFTNTKGANDILDLSNSLYSVLVNDDIVYITCRSEHRVVGFKMEDIINNGNRESSYAIRAYVELGEKNISFSDNYSNPSLLDTPRWISSNDDILAISNFRNSNLKNQDIQTTSIYDLKTNNFIKEVSGIKNLEGNKLTGQLGNIYYIDDNHTGICFSGAQGECSETFYIVKNISLRDKSGYVQSVEEIKGLKGAYAHFDKETKRMYVNNNGNISIYKINSI